MIRFALLVAAAAAMIPSASSAEIQDAIGEIPCHPTDRLLDHVCANLPMGVVVAGPTTQFDPLVEQVLAEILNGPAETAGAQEITLATAPPSIRATVVPSD